MQNDSIRSDDSISSIMRIKTHDDSLRSIFGEENSNSLLNDNSDGTLSSTFSKLAMNNNSVKFDAIEIREYDLTIGDNPSCSEGAPLSLDWFYTDYGRKFNIDDYENKRGHRRASSEMRIPTAVRHDLLMEEWNYSFASIIRANNVIDVIRKERMDTLIKEQKSIRMDVNRKKTKEHIRKLFGIKRSTSL